MSEEYSRIMGNVALAEIINSLKAGEKNVSDIVEDLKKTSPTGIPQLVVELYLWSLQQSGYVQAKGSGPTATYTLTDKWRELEGKASK